MYFLAPDYKPGDAYEFDGPHPFEADTTVRMYHCFRGTCKGGAHYVSDRNTHNQYHNGTWSVPSYESDDYDYDYDWEY